MEFVEVVVDWSVEDLLRGLRNDKWKKTIITVLLVARNGSK